MLQGAADRARPGLDFSTAAEECVRRYTASPGNIMMLGLSSARPVCAPVSARSIEDAITLNGVAVEMNLRSFRAGRPRRCRSDALRRADPRYTAPPTQDEMTLDQLVAHREAHLTAYQNVALARRYPRWSTRRAPRAVTAWTRPSRAQSRSAMRDFAYKDE